MRSRGRVLDATLEIIAQNGFDRVTIAAVADRAGVSRQTVYSIFGSREELVSQAVAQMTFEVINHIQSNFTGLTTAAEYVVELIVGGRTIAREHPVLSRLMFNDPGNPFFDEGMMQRAIPVSAELLAPAVDLDPSLKPHLDSLAELAILIGTSVILFGDDTRTDDETREFLHSWLDPAIAGYKR